jgi:lysozyme family protein
MDATADLARSELHAAVAALLRCRARLAGAARDAVAAALAELEAELRRCAEVAPPVSAGAPPAAPPRMALGFDALAADYARLYASCRIRPERTGEVAYAVTRLLAGKAAYRAVAAEVGLVPWQLVGIIHALEASFDFTRHLHNGDPLAARTRRVPQGRPVVGEPPFTWRQSAVDALMLKELHRVPGWPVPRLLYELERYNGFGYRRRGLPSPYLWSFTTHYTKGKYVRDGVFDPEAVSQQCGAAALLLGLAERGEGLA